MALVWMICLVLVPISLQASKADIKTEKQRISYDIVASDLDHPWSMAFLPSGDILVTEKGGRLLLLQQNLDFKARDIKGLPFLQQHGQGGLLDVVLHPKFKINRWVYFSYAERGDGGYGTTVARGKLAGSGKYLKNFEVIFRMSPKSSGSRHFGSRLVFDDDGYLFITLGDRGDRPRAQDLNDHAGSVIRLHDDGRIPKDNPFAGGAEKLPEIYSYGHRNGQGAALNPSSRQLWMHEHGPQGGDEINIPQPGKNYGWPVITYGVNYVIGTKIGEGTHKAGMEQPVHFWTPSIAPSGMAFYTGEKFPDWQGDLFVGSLKFEQLVRLELENDRVTHEERMLTDEFGRIRDVRQGPDGLLYLLTDESDGKLIRLKPYLP